MGRGVIRGSMVTVGLAGVAASVVLVASCNERVLVGNLRPIDGVTSGFGGSSGLGGAGTGGAGAGGAGGVGGAPYTGTGGAVVAPGV